MATSSPPAIIRCCCFNDQGDCVAAKLRPGNVHSADGWEELLLPEIDRQQAQGKEMAFRGDAALPGRVKVSAQSIRQNGISGGCVAVHAN